MAKAHPKTGEPRQTAQPLSIDRLPPYVHEAILVLRNQAGKTWQEIERLSAEPVGKGKLGFVEWKKLPGDVRELFPNDRIPKSNLHRWFDIRVAQVQEQTLQAAEQARVLAASFSKAVVDDDDQAVMNAIRDTLIGVLQEDVTAKGRQGVAGKLLKLAEVQIKAKTNKLRERKVAVEEQTLQMKIDEMQRKAGELIKDADKVEAGQPVLTREQVLDKVKEIYGVA